MTYLGGAYAPNAPPAYGPARCCPDVNLGARWPVRTFNFQAAALLLHRNHSSVKCTVFELDRRAVCSIA